MGDDNEIIITTPIAMSLDKNTDMFVSFSSLIKKNLKTNALYDVKIYRIEFERKTCQDKIGEIAVRDLMVPVLNITYTQFVADFRNDKMTPFSSLIKNLCKLYSNQ